MNIVEAIFSGGVFRPLDKVSIAENQRVKLTVESANGASTPAPIRTAQDLLQSDLVGIWADRQDIQSSADFARQLRQEAQTRPAPRHAPR